MMSVRSFVSIACVGVGILSVVGCNRDRDREGRERALDRDRQGSLTGDQRPSTAEGQTGTTTVTGAHVGLANNAAVDRIVAARCQREATCTNIGPDKKHVNQQACVQKLRTDMKDDLNANECPRGIDQKELNECLESIQKEDCNNPIDAISRLAACRTSDLCLKTGAPNR